MNYLGYIIILLSPILGAFFSEIYVFLTSWIIPGDINPFVTSTSVVFAILGLIIVLNDDKEHSEG
ncbi:hypothetical protein [Clostridium sp. LIBA-8841]|uniref:hypothetical protein n=1 Tax=Clostridium sp. LIBA-8841 TaxID=2987530 RepID=UPI002AC60E9D|nr:hypothetical protein [Clostridium sp. LIBA-8841]MDZ5253894.1 hypothetical protein [Clostridium sp. LIBA-8841]